MIHVGPSSVDRHGKGKSTMTDALEEPDSMHEVDTVDDKNASAVSTDHEDGANVTSDVLVVFFCQHLFHQACLETMQGRNDSVRSLAGTKGWFGAEAGTKGDIGTEVSHDNPQPPL